MAKFEEHKQLQKKQEDDWKKVWITLALFELRASTIPLVTAETKDISG